MVSITQHQIGIRDLVQQAVNACEISRQDHLQLTSAMLSNPGMAATDRTQINCLLDAIRAGKIRLVD